jgi:hypothetical protein
MSELKLFTTPAEEIELTLLRQAISKLYRDAFAQIDLHLGEEDPQDDQYIVGICKRTLAEAKSLAEAHVEKWRGK